jgi:phage tail sheath gpL-like
MTVDASAVARVTGVTAEFRDLRNGGILYLPQRIALIAQGNTTKTFALDKFRAYSSKQVGDALGFGSPAHLMARELFPDNGDGVGTIPVTVYPQEDAYGSVAATGSITPAGTQTEAAAYRVRVAGVLSAEFVVAASATVAARCDSIVAAINAILHMPVTAVDQTTRVDLVSKWAGASANDIEIEMVGDVTLGGTFTVVQPTGGLVNPDVDDALALVGTVWETLVLLGTNADDTTALDACQTWGEGRWGATVRKPAMVFRGCTDDTVSLATSATSTRTDDKVNVQLVAPGSPNLPGVVAAAQIVRIAKLANNNPAHDYGSQRCPTLIPGDDSVQWLFSERDAAVKAGSSTVEIKDGTVCISDAVTSYAPQGEAVPAYRFVCDIVKLQNIIFNLDLIFASTGWDGAPLIPDNQATTNSAAKKPRMAKAAVNAMIDALGLAAIISDPETAKENTTAVINSQNPKRLDVTCTVQLSGNTNVKDVTLYWGFFFGSPALAA